MQDLRLAVREAISTNRDVLLASPGLDGIRASELKAPILRAMILDMLKEAMGLFTKREVINIVFEELEVAYKSDSQFFGFPLDELERFIIEERTYIVGYLGE